MHMKRLLFVGLAAATMAAAATPAFAAEPTGAILHAGGETAVEGSYIVVFKDTAVQRGAVPTKARELASKHSGQVARTYSAALRGFEARVDAKTAARIAADPSVAYVEQNHEVSISGTQTNPTWGLDRIDQRALPLNNSYTYPNTAPGVRAYVIDTGVLNTHSDFGGRATSGYDFVDNDSNATDCNGHGTHVAGTIAGTTCGVAKEARIVGVRVLDCAGSGTNAGVISGVEWVTTNAVKPAVANMSLGGGANTALDNAVAASIASGVTYAIAAGNSNANACNYSPARTAAAITVGATTNTDARASYSNFGTCLDIFAPGTSITSAWYTSTTATNTISGTSMAAPHVAGAAALVAQANPTWTPAQIRDYLVNNATSNAVTSPGTGSPNKLLYVVNGGTPVNDFSVAVTPTAGSTAPGGSVTATVNTTTTSGTAQTVNLSASGLPSGATATFSPSSVTSGASSTLTISTSAATAPGTYSITVTGTGASGVKTATYTLTVTGSGGGSCSGTNGTDVNIPDRATVTSSIVISGCGRNASSASTVPVNIVHTYRGDLVIDLIAPDGSTYRLKNSSGSDSADNVNTTYTVNLSSEAANGTWRLQVRDAYAGDTGYINSWSLNL